MWDSSRVKDVAYYQRRKYFQDALIEFYRSQEFSVHLSPLNDEDAPLLEFFQTPGLNTVRIKRAMGGGSVERKPVESLHGLFFRTDKICNDIYLVADAGFGKTAFCKRLVLSWCQAMKPVADGVGHFSQEEIDVVSKFPLVFLVSLSERGDLCGISSMIVEQIFPKLRNDFYTFQELEQIIIQERCLVLLDGLDEWNHPRDSSTCRLKHGNAPHRKTRALTTITTTRPWRIAEAGVKASQISEKIEFIRLSQDSANEIKRLVISKFRGETDEYKLRKYVNEFNRFVMEKELSDLEDVPLLLSCLLCMWCDGTVLKQTRGHLYSTLIDFLLSGTIKRGREIPALPDNNDRNIPPCFSEMKHCKHFYPLLAALAEFAFHIQLKESKKVLYLRPSAAVYLRSIAQKFLEREWLTFFFHAGILTQTLDRTKLTVQPLYVSFSQRSFQDFFAALYMYRYSGPELSTMPELVLSKCKCVSDILALSKFLTFLGGFNADLLSVISLGLMKIINEDEVTQNFRCRLDSGKPLKEFQDMSVACCREIARENEAYLCIQDVFIDYSCNERDYSESLRKLTKKNKENIKSVYIGAQDTCFNRAQVVMEYFDLRDLENLDKLHYEGRHSDSNILPALNKSMKCLSLMCMHDIWSSPLHDKVLSLEKLQALQIGFFDISHSQLTMLFDYLSEKQGMLEVKLWSLRCVDHGNSCTGSRLDMSQLISVKKLTLQKVPVSELNIALSSMDECSLGLLNPNLVLRFLHGDPEDSKLYSFICGGLRSPAAIDIVMETLRLLGHIKDVVLCDMNLGNRPVYIPTPDIQLIQLVHMTVSAAALRNLVDTILILPQSVSVLVQECVVTPSEEFERMKERIQASEHFRVLANSHNWFQLMKVKNDECAMEESSS